MYANHVGKKYENQNGVKSVMLSAKRCKAVTNASCPGTAIVNLRGKPAGTNTSHLHPDRERWIVQIVRGRATFDLSLRLNDRKRGTRAAWQLVRVLVIQQSLLPRLIP